MRRQQRHAYDPAEIESLKGIPIPEKIKCGRCNKNLPQLKYSIKQLTDLRWQVKQGRVTKPINCHQCTGGSQIVEIECVVCHKTKGLEEFAKSQRAKPDTARCEKCTDELVKQKPINHHGYATGTNTFITPDHVNGFVPDPYSSAASTHESEAVIAQWEDWSSHEKRTEDGTETLSSDFKRAMSVKSSTDGVLIDSDVSESGHSKDKKDDEWKVVSDKSWHTRSTGPSATSSGGSVHTYSSSIAERSTGKSGGWAKIKAYRPDSPPAGGPVMRPHGDAQREFRGAWSSDEESSEDETYDDDSDGENTVI